MNEYELQATIPGITTQNIVKRDDGVFIPCVIDNIDCVKFLKDWRNGANVTNADGKKLSYSDDAVKALKLTPQ